MGSSQSSRIGESTKDDDIRLFQSSSNKDDDKTIKQNNSKDKGGHSENLTNGQQIVLKKLSSIGYDKGTNRKELEKFAEILSDKEKLLNAYLHTDFSIARELQKEVQEMKFISQKQKSPTIGIATSQSTAPMLPMSGEGTTTFSENKNKIEDYNDEEELMDEEELAMSEQLAKANQGRNTSIRVKLIVSETSRSTLDSNIKRFVSPFLSSSTLAPSFGLFHIALGIGPWKIEWNNSSLCIPRRITGKNAIVCADLESISTSHHLDEVREKIAKVIIKWNTSKYYTSNPNTQKDHGNCQQFIDEILQELQINTEEPNNNENTVLFPHPLKQYISRLRKKGAAQMIFEFSNEMKEVLKDGELIKEHPTGVVHFSTHTQLDSFVIALFNECIDFETLFPYEFYMLKAFDRAFWMRYLKINPDQSLECKHPLATVTQPHISHYLVRCPFEDPQKTSILPLRVKLSQ